MKFTHDTDRFRNFFSEDNFLECRRVFKKQPNPEDQNAELLDEVLTGDPEIDDLVDGFKLKLILLREKRERMESLHKAAQTQREVLRQSRQNIADFMREIRDGAALEETMEETMDQIDMVEAQIQGYEGQAALERFKDEFINLHAEIMQKKAEVTREALEMFVDASPGYLERLKEAPDMQDDVSVSIAEHILSEIENGGTTLEEVEADLLFYTEGVDDLTEEEHEIKGMFRDSTQRLREARYVEYLVSDVLTEEWKNLLHRAHNSEFRREGTTLGEAMETLIVSMLEEATVGDDYNPTMDYYLDDGPVAELYDIADALGSRDIDPTDWSPYELSRLTGDDAIDLLPEPLFSFAKTELPGLTSDHEVQVKVYSSQLEEIRDERSFAMEDKRAHEYALAAYGEKERAYERIDMIFQDVDEASEAIRNDYFAAKQEELPGRKIAALTAASYALQESDDLLTAILPPKKTPDVNPTSLENLMSEYDTFVKNQVPFEDVYDRISRTDSETANDIKSLVEVIGKSKVHFVSQDVFDGYFNGETIANGEPVDDLRGGQAVFFNGRVILVYEPGGNIDAPLMKEILTHESIHASMHAEEGTVDQIISALLYKGRKREEGGLELALAQQTYGAKMINAFIQAYEYENGDFTDWVHTYTNVNASNVTFEDVIKSEELANEVLEEIITMYLTKRATEGARESYDAKYLNLMNEFYNSTAGNALLSRFTPESAKAKGNTILSYQAGPGSDGDAVAGGGSVESGEKLQVPTFDSMDSGLNTIENNVLYSIQEHLKELYGVEDYEDIVKNAKKDVEKLRRQVKEYREDEQNGRTITDDDKRSLASTIEKLNTDLSDDVLGKLKNEEKLRQKNPEDEWGYFKRLWKKTTFVAVDDVLKMFQDMWGYLKERRELRKDRVSSEIGTGVAPTERMRAHFEGLQQSAQNKDVAQWKEKYDDKDPDTIDEVLKNASDENQIKALFEMKANNWGDFFFRDPKVLGALSRMTGHKIQTYQQAKDAFDDVFGTGEADGLERINSSTRQGKVSESESMGKEHAKDLGTQWMLMIRNKQEGKWVDSAKYEGFIHYALNAGKSWNRQVVWMIAKGHELGILDHKVLVDMGGSGLIAKSPYIEHLGEIVVDDENNVPYKDGKTELEYIASLDLFDDDGTRTDLTTATDKQIGDWRKFEEWFINGAPNTKSMIERREKLKSATDNMDHDYIQDIWWDYEIASYDSIFNEQTGARQMIQHPGIANTYGQFLVNSIYWDDNKLSHMFAKWFTVDQLITEENYEKNQDGSFKMSTDGNVRMKKNNRTVVKESQLKTLTGAMYGPKWSELRNAAYQAYKQYGARGDMKGARDYMMAALLYFGETKWIPESTMRATYAEHSDWNFERVEQIRNRMKERKAQGFDPIPEAPVSHMIIHNGDSIERDLKDDGLSYGQGLQY